MEEKPYKEVKENDDKCKCNYELEKYKIAIDFLKFEGTTLWQIFSAYFVGNTIIIGFISEALLNDKNEHPHFCWLLFAGIIGLTFSIVWLRTFNGNSNWYHFRMAQAKDAEKKFVECLNDNEWYLLNKEAFLFAKGNKVNVATEKIIEIKTKKNEDLKSEKNERNKTEFVNEQFSINEDDLTSNNKDGGSAMIGIFIFLYVIIIFISFFNLFNKC